MALYRGKYILEGLEKIPPEMLRDLDLAYDACLSLKKKYPCEMCGKCCHQPFITVRDEEVERISEFVGTDPLTFVMNYLDRDETENKWLFRKTNPCAFYENKKCKIWKGRPEICDDFPYMVSMFMSRVYLAIVNDSYKIDLSYMDDTWPCTKIIKTHVNEIIENAKKKRRENP